MYGEPADEWHQLASLDARLDIDGETVAEGTALVPGGDAFEVFCAFARSVGAHCGGLHPGQYVTTGSLTGLRFIEPGQPVVGHVAGLGRVAVAFAPG